jgi:hypothetical protein
MPPSPEAEEWRAGWDEEDRLLSDEGLSRGAAAAGDESPRHIAAIVAQHDSAREARQTEEDNMSTEDDLAYHRARARDELNLAMDAPSGAASAAHLRLSALHLRRFSELVRVGRLTPNVGFPALATAPLDVTQRCHQDETAAA